MFSVAKYRVRYSQNPIDKYNIFAEFRCSFMKLNLAALVFLLSVLSWTVSAQKDSVFVSNDGGFSVVTPRGFEKLKYESRSRDTESGTVDASQYSLTLDRGTCLISYYELPEKTFQTKSPDNIFSDSIAEILRKGDTTITSQRNLVIDGFPAISFDLRVANIDRELYTHTVMVVAKPRAYTFLFGSKEKSQLSTPDVVNFFKTIRIQNVQDFSR